MVDAATKRKKVYTILLIVVLATILVKGGLVVRSNVKTPPTHKDYPRWHRIARRALEGKTLADPRGAEAVAIEDHEGEVGFYKLPPAWAIYTAPLGLFQVFGAYVYTYYYLSVGCGVLCVFLAMRTIHGRWLPEDPWKCVIPVFFFLPLAVDDLHNGNTSLILLLPLMAGAYLASRGRRVLGALGWGLCAALKAYPAAAVGALLFVRRWRLMLLSVAAALAWTLLIPGLIRGFERTWNDNRAWAERIVMPYLEGKEKTQWDSKAHSVRNQSLWGAVTRFTRPLNAMGEYADEDPIYVNFLSLSSKESTIIFAALVLIAAGITAGVCWRAGPPTGPLTTACDYSLAMTFILLASPLVWTYYLTVLLLPMTLGAEVALRHRKHPLGKMCLWAFVITVPLFFGGLSMWARAFGTLGWIGVLWYVVLLVLRARMSELEGADGPTMANEEARTTNP